MLVKILLAAFFFSVFLYFYRKHQLATAQKLLNRLNSSMGAYELEIIKDFEVYLKDKMVVENKNGQKHYLKTSKFINANITASFSTIRAQIARDIRKKIVLGRPSFFNWSASVIRSEELKYYKKNISGGRVEVLRFLNPIIIDKSVKYAIEEFIGEVSEPILSEGDISAEEEEEEEEELIKIKKLKKQVHHHLRFTYNVQGEEMRKLMYCKEEWFTLEEKLIYRQYLAIMANPENFDPAIRVDIKIFQEKMRLKYDHKFIKEFEFRKNKPKREKFLGAEFIALRAFNLDTLLTHRYPLEAYNNFYMWLKRRENNPEKTLKELEEKY